MMKFIIVNLVAILAVTQANLQSESRVQGSLYEGWPDHCCRLETRQIKYGDRLPEDYVPAGEMLGQRFAYVIDFQFQNSIKFKSEIFNQYPYSTNQSCTQDNVTPFLDVLVNPNKCSLSYYRLRYDYEAFPETYGHLFPGGKNFAPAIAGVYFGTYETTSERVPAVHKGMSTQGCKLKSYATATPVSSTSANHTILTVDCLKSLVTMSNGVLNNVTYPNGAQPTQKSDVTYFHRTYRNDSPMPQKQKVGFSVERTNTIHVSLSESYASSRCDEHSNSFSSAFGSEVSTEVGVVWGPFSASVGASVSSAIEQSTSSASSACSAEGKNRTSAETKKETMRYTFSDEVTIPAKSLTTVNAFTSPFQGTVDYRMTYKLSPRVGERSLTSNILMNGLKFYSMADQVEINGTDIFVHFDGKISIDSGYEVTVDVVSVPLNESKDAHNTNILASYNLIPDQQ